MLVTALRQDTKSEGQIRFRNSMVKFLLLIMMASCFQIVSRCLRKKEAIYLFGTKETKLSFDLGFDNVKKPKKVLHILKFLKD